MKISDLIVMCTRNLTRRKFRTFLTIMGVVIGTCAIVVMLSLGLGISAQNQATLEAMGDLTIIEIYAYSATVPLTDEVMAQIIAMDGVKVATPLMEYNPYSGMQFYAGRSDRYLWYAWNVVGMYPEAIPELGYAMAEGELLTESDDGKVIQMMLGARSAYEFNDTKRRYPNNYVDYWSSDPPPDPFIDPLDTQLKLVLEPEKDGAKPVEFAIEVVGILQEDYSRGYETVYGGVMDINDMKRIQTEYEKANAIKKDPGAAEEGYNNARVKCVDIDAVAEVEAAIRGLEYGYDTNSMEETRRTMQESAQQLQTILGALGAVSLFVAAISIINTMIMSVYERTREIGVMKVLGCVLGDIRSVFLMEAGLIGLIGGILGNGVSYALSAFLNANSDLISSLMGNSNEYYWYAEEPVQTAMSIIPPWLALTGLVIATTVGLISGILPALRAVKISALEAIRTE